MSGEEESRESYMKRIQTLGQCGDTGAISELVNMLGRDIGFDAIIINQLISINSAEAMRASVSLLGSTSSRLRHYVTVKLEGLGRNVAPVLIDELNDTLKEKNFDKAIAIIHVLKSVGEGADVRALRRILHRDYNHVNFKVALLETLVHLDPQTSAPMLIEQICDGVDDIAYSAISMLNDNLSPSVISGVQNVIAGKLISVVRIVELLVFSSATKFIEALHDNKEIMAELKRLCSLPGMESYAKRYGIEQHVDQESSETVSKKASIWALDDSRMILRMYEHFAVDAGVEITTFESGAVLLDALKKDTPSLFFIDLNMPGTTGVEVAGKIRKTGADKVPLVLVTTQTDVEHDEDIRSGLFNDIVVKPFTTDTLIDITNKYL